MVTKHFLNCVAVLALCLSIGADAFTPPFKCEELLSSSSVIFISRVPLDDGSGVPFVERSRPYRRTQYTQADWQKHRVRDRFRKNLLSISKSGIVRELKDELQFMTMTSTLVCAYNCFAAVGWSDFSGNYHPALASNINALQMPILFFILSSPALSLLLVFKTKSSYARWDEVRKAWGKIVNSSRTIMRQSAAWLHNIDLPLEERYHLLARLSTAIWCFARSLTRHVLSAREDDLAFLEECRTKLPSDLAESLIAAKNRPNRATYELSCAIRELPLTDLQRVTLDESVSVLCDALGTNDRILSSPLPLVYTRHLSRSLELWLLFLPLGMWPAFANSWNHIAMIPFTVILSYFLLGIEELGMELQEPFSILPLHNITTGIARSAEDQVQWFLIHEERMNQEYYRQVQDMGVNSSSALDTKANATFPIKGWLRVIGNKFRSRFGYFLDPAR